ncbi:MAG: hypothetical protein H8K06_09300 [Nitrospira sp.]|uniref:HPr kinase n=1 Tax=Nitrospira defluvii TaxID=330214 RepID=A0ABN7LBY6_9BACT|nr:hypothetical protein [Nitrospira defluvii]MCS6327266.1 hypothetical protein [Nitrospira sp.]CAE6736353.1 conserved hypothetical protein [Nitrospira defluvii]
MFVTSATKEIQLSVHGTEMTFTTNSHALAHSVESLLRHFKCQTPATESIPMQFTAVQQRSDIPLRISGKALLLHSGSGLVLGCGSHTTWRCDIYLDQGVLFADFHEEGLVVIDSRSQSAQGYLVRPEDMAPDIRNSFVHFAMTELLKRRGIFTFHATALEYQGKGVLIPGFSGRGKTTSFLSLLRSGYRYLSDDHPFFRVTDSGVELLPYPLKINVTDQTVSYFPELRNAPPSVLRAGTPKRYFYPEDLYPSPLGQSCTPAIILFPSVVNSPHSCLEPLSKKLAMEMILPHSLLVYEPEVARQEFKALVRLIQDTDCYRLHFGRDVVDLPWLVTPLLDNHSMKKAS